jgi:AraC-like DNA-binding protein
MAINPRKNSVPPAMVSQPPAQPGHVWVGPLYALGELIRTLGGDADEVFRAARVDQRDLADPDFVLPIAVRGEILARAAQATGHEHFGLLLCGQGIHELGVPGTPMLKRPSVGEALEAISAFWLRHTAAELSFIRRSGDDVAFGHAVMDGNISGMPQLQDGAMATFLNIMREMLGSDWRPTAVNLMRPEPRNPAFHAQFFGVDCRFNAARSELVFSAATLDYRLKHRDARGAGLAQAPLDDRDWSAYVQRLAYRQLLQGECSQLGVAAALGISSRTLVRKLEIAGTSYQQLLEGVRFSASRTMLRETNLAFAEIAEALGYNEASSFTRAFQRWTGMSPSSWRKSKKNRASPSSDRK